MLMVASFGVFCVRAERITGGGDTLHYRPSVNLSLEPPHAVPGIIMLGGQWEHWPGEAFEEHPAHYTFGILIPS